MKHHMNLIIFFAISCVISNALPHCDQTQIDQLLKAFSSNGILETRTIRRYGSWLDIEFNEDEDILLSKVKCKVCAKQYAANRFPNMRKKALNWKTIVKEMKKNLDSTRLAYIIRKLNKNMVSVLWMTRYRV